MGYIRHDAIVVTSYKKEDLVKAREKAVELGLHCTAFVDSGVNGYMSFLIAPDGSKEGWETSENSNSARARWVYWVRTNSSTKGIPVKEWDKCLTLDWIHVSYGGDEPDRAYICEHNKDDDEQ